MITELKQEKRLKRNNANIKSIFYDSGYRRQRNTDNSKNEDVKQGVLIEKQYYVNGELLKTENKFDSRIQYTYQFDGSDEYKCKNCGMEGHIKDFEKGCPYCHTNYNIDYDNKELSNKQYYDLITNDKTYKIKTLLLDIIVSLLTVGTYIYKTGRTFYLFDVIKITVASLLFALILFYFFYYVDALIILPSIRRKKEAQNEKQKAFWNRIQKYGIDKTTFYNNLNYELRNLFFSDKYPNTIDYDVIDYNWLEEKEEKDELFVTVNVEMRIVNIIKNEIKSKTETKEFTLKKVNNSLKLKKKVNYIQCPNCGASIDATTKNCEYCNSPHNYLQEWYLVENK